MYLILLKDRSSWLRFLSWSKASLGTSFREFRATFSRRRSLGKLWSVWACVGMFVTAANHWSYGCKYNILKGNGPSELIPIRPSGLNQCPTGRVFQYRVGSGRVLEKMPGSGSGSGRVGMLKNTIGYFRVSFLLSGNSG